MYVGLILRRWKGKTKEEEEEEEVLTLRALSYILGLNQLGDPEKYILPRM